jgi:SAM-dependent methyltransferase
MPFRPGFDCLWCGTSHVTRTPQDLEGWASLCPTCIGRAGDNGFLRARLRTALAERSRAADAGVPAPAGRPPDGDGLVDDPDDFYRRAGRFSTGVIEDAAWLMELDAVTAWLDGLRLGPVVVELGAGSGWWSPLLASRGELWAYDADDAALDRLRQRLVAHGLRAHLHRRDLDAPAERAVDAVFTAFALGSAPDDAVLARRLAAIAGWLRPGGSFAFVEAAVGTEGRTVDGPAGPLRPFDQVELRARLERHGLRLASVPWSGAAIIAGVAERAVTDVNAGAAVPPLETADSAMASGRR